MKTILALIDFSDVTTKILDQAVTFASAFGAEIILMHVVPQEHMAGEGALPISSAEAFHARQRRLLTLRDSVAAWGVKVAAHQFEGPMPGAVLEHITLLNPDVIMVGSHGHGALYNLIVGSVTAAIIKNVGKPVLVIPSVGSSHPSAPSEAAVPQMSGQEVQSS